MMMTTMGSNNQSQNKVYNNINIHMTQNIELISFTVAVRSCWQTHRALGYAILRYIDTHSTVLCLCAIGNKNRT